VNNFLKEALGYVAASACALLVDMTALWLLVHFLALGYLVAATVSFLLGAIVAYELSVKLAFRHHRLRDRRAELAAFIIIGAGGLAINTLVIFVGVDYFGLHYLFAKSIAAGFTFACNFIARRQILFVPRSAV
jgi:putative flippase GtrA